VNFTPLGRVVALAVLCAASFSRAQQSQPLSFRADAPGIDENPLRGFVPFVGEIKGTDFFPTSLEWFYMPLSDIVKGENTYDWTALDKQLAGISSRGHQAIFRFYVDYPKRPSGIPAYLIADGLKTFPYNDDGNGNDAVTKTHSVAPDYSDPRLIQCFTNFVHALGARYDGDTRIAFLTVGLYGFWGEFHVHRHPTPGEPAGWAISQRDIDAILQAWVDSFHKTHIEARYAFITPNHELLSHFGFEDDSFLQDTLGDPPARFWSGMKAGNMTDSWKRLPTGGEVRPELEAGLWNTWPPSQGQDIVSAIQTIHPTWMLESEMFRAPSPPAVLANALRADRLLGYTFFASRFSIIPGPPATLNVRIENRGIAPFYYNWPVEAEIVDSHGQTLSKTTGAWPLPSLLPNTASDWTLTFDAIPPSATAILLHIPNPMSGGHPIAFANAEMSTVRPGWLTLKLPPNR